MTPPPPSASFEGVSKIYASRLQPGRRIEALRDVSFEAPSGSVTALIGPNRAGKTTLVKILLSIARATSGRVFRLGRPVEDRSTLSRVGYVHENPAFPRYLSAESLLAYYGALTQVPAERLAERIPLLIGRVGLTDRAREPISRFSKGMLQRLALAQALLGEPDLLVLDEPSEGMDLVARRVIQETIERQRDAGRTTILISHQLRDVERMCDRGVVLAEGRLVFAGALGELKECFGARGDDGLEDALFRVYQRFAEKELRPA